MHVMASAATAGDILGSVLDAVHHEVVVLDRDGRIILTNDRFMEFGRRNGLQEPESLLGVDYIDVCLHAGIAGDATAARAALGLQQLLKRRSTYFELTYPCHSPLKQRWFRMTARPWKDGAVLVHEDVTGRRIADMAIMRVLGRGRASRKTEEVVQMEHLLMAWAQRMEGAVDRSIIVEDFAEALTLTAAEAFVEALTRLVWLSPPAPGPITIRGAPLAKHFLIEISGLQRVDAPQLDALMEAMDHPPRINILHGRSDDVVQLMLVRSQGSKPS